MDWHKEYLEKYKKLKSEGKPFFPYSVFKDTLVAFLILALLCYFAWHFGASLEDPADPTDSNYNPRPEWYFLFLFQALKVFPGNLESVAAVVLPGAAVTYLFLLPFLDKKQERDLFFRKRYVLSGALALGGIGALTYLGAKSPMINPIIEHDPVVFAGQKLYTSLNCSYCHKIGGKGGTVGPELDKVAGSETVEWLEKHFRDPQSVSPGSRMPKLNLLDDEIRSLVAYMKSFGAGEKYTEEAPKLFTDNCAACHRIGNEGAAIGPDMSYIGTAQDKRTIKRYIEDPSKINKTSIMPGFRSKLTDTQIEDLARYLSAQKGEETKPK